MKSNLKNDCLSFLWYVSQSSDTVEGVLAHQILKKHNVQVPYKEAKKIINQFEKSLKP